MMTQTATEKADPTLMVYPETLSMETREPLEFVDVTDLVRDVVHRSRVRNGFVNVQSLHTTTAILVNEHEPLLIEDMKKALHRLAPCEASYQHDDFGIRTVNMCPGEEKNGHAHCKALFLRTSETLNIFEGALRLGRWQRIFLVELDRPKQRSVSVMVLGHPVFDGDPWP
jgi:secondary thiamine-phosphate synthase enzyme